MSKSNGRHNKKLQQHLNAKLIAECASIVIVASVLLLATICLADNPPVSQPISSRAAFLRAQRASRLQQSQPQQAQTPAVQAAAASSSNQTVVATSQPAQVSTSTTAKPKPALREPKEASVRQAVPIVAIANRTTRTADIEDFNIFVTNTCERELMHVNIKTSKPFFGVIHTRNQRQKSVCTTEGTGETEYNLDISHVLNPQDPNYCGVIKARRESPEDKDLLSVVIAVRVHKNIELSNDKFFLLNCTNRCRRADCSTSPNSRLVDPSNNLNARVISDELPEGERESVTPASRPGSESSPDPSRRDQKDECTIYKFPWVITLLWCLGVLLLASLISHCIMCSSMVCRCVRTEVEEREPSVYEGDTDDEDNLYNKKNHPMRIDYDNRDIYKTSNNYEPYNMSDDNQVKPKSRHTSSKRTGRR